MKEIYYTINITEWVDFEAKDAAAKNHYETEHENRLTVKLSEFLAKQNLKLESVSATIDLLSNEKDKE